MGDRPERRDELDARDLSFLEGVYPALSIWIRSYFRADIRGLEQVPEDPVVFVANHSGGLGSPDSIVFILGFMDQFGLDRPLYWLGHDLLFSLPGIGAFLRRCGVIPAARDSAEKVLRNNGSLVVYPGGETELHRPWSARNEIRFEGRTGFLQLARETGAPVVPVVSYGGHHTYLCITDGRRLARLLRLDRTLRLKTLPLALAAPWGLTLGFVPHLPLPARIRVRVCAPIHVDERFGDDLDLAYRHVTGVMQRTLDELAH